MPLVRSDRLRPCGVSNDEQAPPRVYSYRTTLILCRGSATEPLTRGEGARTSRRKHGRYLLFQVFLLLGSRGDMMIVATPAKRPPCGENPNLISECYPHERKQL